MLRVTGALIVIGVLIGMCQAACADSVARHDAPRHRPRIGLEGYCPVTLHDGHRWQKGQGQFSSIHRGCLYVFESAAKKLQFDMSPDTYAPVKGGLDIVLWTDARQCVPGRRRHGLWCDGGVYLFASETSLETFCANVKYYIGREFQP